VVPSSTIRASAALLLLLAAAPRTAEARATRAIELDTTPDQAMAVVIATIRSVSVGPAENVGGNAVLPLRLPLQLVEVIKAPPSDITSSTAEPPGAPWRTAPELHHWRRVPGTLVRPNAPSYVPLQAGATYLLFLAKGPGGKVVLFAEEDSDLPELTGGMLSKAIAGRSATAPFERSVEILEAALSQCVRKCRGTIGLLGRSSRYLKLIAAPGPRRTALIGQLSRFVRTSRDLADVQAAAQVLGQLDEQSIIPTLVGRISAPALPGQKEPQSSTLQWLQGYPPATEIAALKEIVKQANDPATREEAKSRLTQLTGKP
jgi:hypothetical protein